MSQHTKGTLKLCGKILVLATIGRCVPFGGCIVVGYIVASVIAKRHVVVMKTGGA